MHGEVVPRLHHLPAQVSQAGDQVLLPGQRHLVHRDALPKLTWSKFTVRSETSCSSKEKHCQHLWGDSRERFLTFAFHGVKSTLAFD